MPDITPPDPSKLAQSPHSPGNPPPSAAANPAEPVDWAEAFKNGPGRIIPIPEPECTVYDPFAELEALAAACDVLGIGDIVRTVGRHLIFNAYAHMGPALSGAADQLEYYEGIAP